MSLGEDGWPHQNMSFSEDVFLAWLGAREDPVITENTHTNIFCYSEYVTAEVKINGFNCPMQIITWEHRIDSEAAQKSWGKFS